MLLWQSSRQGFANENVAMDQVRFERGSWMLISLTSETDKRSATSTSPDNAMVPAQAAGVHTPKHAPFVVSHEDERLLGGSPVSETGAWGWLQVTAPLLSYFMVRIYHAVISSTSASPKVLLFVSFLTLATAAAPSTLD